MSFLDIFRDKNDFNEKTIVGFLSFGIMAIFAFADLISSLFFDGVVVNEYIYNSFLVLALGSFGISEVSKAVGKGVERFTNKGENIEEEEYKEYPTEKDYRDRRRHYEEQH